MQMVEKESTDLAIISNIMQHLKNIIMQQGWTIGINQDLDWQCQQATKLSQISLALDTKKVTL